MYPGNTKDSKDLREDGIFKARILADLFNDKVNHFYLLFLQLVLFEMNVVNKEFQAANAEILKLNNDLYCLLVENACRILKPNFLPDTAFETIKRAIKVTGNNFNDSFLNLDDVNYGDEFISTVCNTSAAKEKIIEVKIRCRNFIKCMCVQLIERIPNT